MHAMFSSIGGNDLFTLTEVTIVSRPDMIDVTEEDSVVQVCATLLALESTERDIVVRLETMDDTGYCCYFNLIH